MKVKDAYLNSGGVSQYVRTAEKLLAAGNYRMAIDAMSVAQELDPHNPRLQGVVERALMLEAKAAAIQVPQGGLMTESEKGRYLAVTVGHQFEDGIKENNEGHLSAQEVRAQVKYLVDTAGMLLNRGLNVSAFESLMQAYLLDPLAPELISSEQKILPVLEAMRNRPVQEASVFHSTPDFQGTEDSTARNSDLPKKDSLFRRWLRGR